MSMKVTKEQFIGMTYDELLAENTRLWEVISDAEESARLILHESRMLQAENAKLLELVLILAYCMSDGRDCDRCALNGADMPTPRISACDELPEMLRELGVEVEQ